MTVKIRLAIKISMSHMYAGINMLNGRKSPRFGPREEGLGGFMALTAAVSLTAV
jgi:hypothetical protein